MLDQTRDLATVRRPADGSDEPTGLKAERYPWTVDKQPAGSSGSRTRRLAAIMFTDMVGYSAISEQDEARAIALLNAQSHVMKPLLELHGGRVIRTMGDGTFVEFGSALAACRAALDIQIAVQKHSEVDDFFQLRIGIHVGDVEVAGDDLLGHGVNVAARIETLADPGGICISEDVARQVRGRIGAALEAIGPRKLKGIEEEIRLFRLNPAGPVAAKSNAAKTPPSIAVLPFANLSPDSENEFFAEGLTEEILLALSKVRTLSVVSRTSCFALKGAAKPVKELGRLLEVNHVLEGSVRKAGNRIRITVQLIAIDKDRPIFSDRFDRELEDIFAIQEEITTNVVDALQIAISEAEKGALAMVPTKNIRAYEAYVRAMTVSWIQPPNAVPHFEEAIRLDPEFAKALAAEALNSLLVVRFMSGEDVSYVERARRSAQRAIELDPTLPEAHAALAEIAFHDGRTDAAIAAYERALELDPNSYEVLYNYGRLLLLAKDFPNAVRHFRRAGEVRPDEYQPLVMMSRAIGEIEGEEAEQEVARQALERIERRLRCCPEEARAYVLGSMLLVKTGAPEKGREYVRRALELEPTSSTFYNAACFYALDGEYERAIETLEKAFELGINFGAWLRSDPDLKPILENPRVQAVIEKMDSRLVAE